MRVVGAILVSIAIAGCSGDMLPATAEFDASPREVFAAATQDNLGLPPESLVSNMGARKLYRLEIPAGDLAPEHEGDETLEIEIWTQSPDYIDMETTLDATDTTYTLRLEFEPLDAGERTRVSVVGDAEGEGERPGWARMQIVTRAQAQQIFARIRDDLES